MHTCAVQAAWTGVPHALRPRVWRLLLRYEPPSAARAAGALARKRREYRDLAPAYYDVDNTSRSEDDLADLKQARHQPLPCSTSHALSSMPAPHATRQQCEAWPRT
jgi:hypothetical protein